MQEPPTFRFGVRNLMAYTVVCSVAFLAFSLSHRAGSQPMPLKIRVFSDLAILCISLLALGVVGLGPAAFRTCFVWVGKICISLMLGGIVAILTIAGAKAVGLHPNLSLTLGGLSMVASTTASIVMAFGLVAKAAP